MKKFSLKKDRRLLFCAFVIPLLLMAMVYAAEDVWPFGEKSVLVLDLNGQYVYYFEALRRVIREGGSLIYSWSRALGGEFLGIFAYYLASPFSLITALFPDGAMTEALLTIILLKVGAMGASMAFYLSRREKNDPVKIVIISTMYALSSYAVVQAHNTMWIDALIYLPLITYGIEQLIKKGRFRLFIVSLALCLMANYYIGYMVCIYTAIYFIFYYIAYAEKDENNFYLEKGHFIKSLLRITAASVVAVSLAAWILLPAYTSLTFGKTTFSNPSFTPDLKFDPLDFVTKFFIGSYDTVEPSGLPFVYCGTLMPILLAAYFFSKKFSARKKIMYGALLSVFAVSFATTTLDLVWHGFQNPNWLNYRYSFMFIFIALVMSYDAMCYIEHTDFHKITAAVVFMIILSFILQKLNYDNIGKACVIGTLVACAALLLALHAVRYGYLERGGVLILAVVVSVEMFSGAVLNTSALDADVTVSKRDSYNTFIDRLTPSVESIKMQDSGFYRTEKTVHRKTNDPLALDFYGLSNSTSTLNSAQIDFLAMMGYSSKSHWSKYLGGTPLSDSLLGIKYIITDRQFVNSPYHFFEEDAPNNLYTYINPYALPVAFCVNDSVRDLNFSSYETPFEFMNDMVTAMLGRTETVEIFSELEIEATETENLTNSFVSDHIKYTPNDETADSRITYTVTAQNTENVYVYVPTKYPRECDLSVNTYSKATYFGNETMRIVDVGSYKEGEKLRISFKLNDDCLYVKNGCTKYFYYLDTKLFNEIMPQLSNSGCEITEHSDTFLSGEVNVSSGDNTLFTTIPYDEGWQIYIDGERVQTFKTVDTLLAAQISEGTHKVELYYRPSCLRNGIIISVSGAVIFAVTIALECHMRRKKKKTDIISVDIRH